MQIEAFVEKLGNWTVEVQRGNLPAAQKQLDGLYRVGASLVASKEFQALAMERWQHSLDQQVVENLRLFCGLVQAAADLKQERQQPEVVPIRRAA